MRRTHAPVGVPVHGLSSQVRARPPRILLERRSGSSHTENITGARWAATGLSTGGKTRATSERLRVPPPPSGAVTKDRRACAQGLPRMHCRSCHGVLSHQVDKLFFLNVGF